MIAKLPLFTDMGDERAVALNQKGALFACSDEGDDNWAVITTLIKNCNFSALNPHTWPANSC